MINPSDVGRDDGATTKWTEATPLAERERREYQVAV
eukprot:COSAG02_NODE_58567_length_277_cov_0.573034_1_plen_35_part_10